MQSGLLVSFIQTGQTPLAALSKHKIRSYMARRIFSSKKHQKAVFAWVKHTLKGRRNARILYSFHFLLFLQVLSLHYLLTSEVGVCQVVNQSSQLENIRALSGIKET